MDAAVILLGDAKKLTIASLSIQEDLFKHPLRISWVLTAKSNGMNGCYHFNRRRAIVYSTAGEEADEKRFVSSLGHELTHALQDRSPLSLPLHEREFMDAVYTDRSPNKILRELWLFFYSLLLTE